MNAVFDIKPGTTYEDDLGRRYHFPNRYRAVVERALGRWGVFRRPRADGGSMAYVGMARVVDVVADRARRNYYYANFEDFIPFENAVPWRVDGHHLETPLREFRPKDELGWYLKGKSVRELSDVDFDLIVSAGLSDLDVGARAEILADQIRDNNQEYPDIDSERINRSSVPVMRKIRLAAFRESVRKAYGQRCAVTRIRILDRGHRPEVQAAHIYTVEEGGPDVVQNGIALSGTAHWLFDRHLISISDDYKLLVATDFIPPHIMTLLQPSIDGIHLPNLKRDWPLKRYLARHRAKFSRIIDTAL